MGLPHNRLGLGLDSPDLGPAPDPDPGPPTVVPHWVEVSVGTVEPADPVGPRQSQSVVYLTLQDQDRRPHLRIALAAHVAGDLARILGGMAR